MPLFHLSVTWNFSFISFYNRLHFLGRDVSFSSWTKAKTWGKKDLLKKKKKPHWGVLEQLHFFFKLVSVSHDSEPAYMMPGWMPVKLSATIFTSFLLLLLFLSIRAIVMGGRLNFVEFIKQGTDGGPVTFRAHMRKWLMVNQVCDDFLLILLYCLFWFFVCVFLYVFVYHSVLCNPPSNCAWEIDGLLKSSMFTSYIFIIMSITFPVL